VKFRVTGVPRRSSLKKATCSSERGGPTVDLAIPRYRSFVSVLHRLSLPFQPRWLSTLIVRVPLLLHSCSLVTKGARAPWPQRPINFLQRGCVSRIEPSTGPSKPTYGPTANGVHAFILLQPMLYEGRSLPPPSLKWIGSTPKRPSAGENISISIRSGWA